MPPAGIEVLHDVVFGKGGTQELHAEIAYPKNASKPIPAILFLHGGGWLSGNYKQSPIRQIAQSGYFGASIEYRLTTVAKWPAQIQDCKLAIRWLRGNAAKYNIDPNRIGVWGETSGGHLAACLATMGDVKEYEGDGGYPGVSSAIQAAVITCPQIDLTNPSSFPAAAHFPIERLFGVPYTGQNEIWKTASPVFYVKAGNPPMFLAHGDSDVLVPVQQTLEFDAALTKAGVPHQLLIAKNGAHGLRPKTGATMEPSMIEITKDFFAFFDKNLKSH